MDFTNKVIVITGASSGIGKQVAIEFGKLGTKLVLIGRKKDKLEQTAMELKKFSCSTMICQCDVSKKNEVDTMTNLVLKKFGSVDILINNAGFAIYGSVSDLSIDEIELQMQTNYLGMVYCIKKFLPSMLHRKSGHIVNVASVAASFGLPGIASYCASKFAMLGFSEGLKHELKNSGVDITVVSPIMVRTNFFDHPSFEKMPKYSPTSLDPKAVAKAVAKAANSKKLEIIVPSVVRSMVWMKHTFPFIINPIMGKSFKKQLDISKN